MDAAADQVVEDEAAVAPLAPLPPGERREGVQVRSATAAPSPRSDQAPKTAPAPWPGRPANVRGEQVRPQAGPFLRQQNGQRIGRKTSCAGRTPQRCAPSCRNTVHLSQIVST